MNGLDLRIFVLDGTTRAVLVRVPVGVTGDAKSTVGELLARKKELFSNNPLTRNVQIDSWSIQDPPGIDLDFVPSLGQRISFHSNAADSKIADLVEISSMVPPRLLSLAENATKVIPGLHLSCLDLIVKDISKAPEDDNAYIVSIRSIPDISDVSFANYGDIPDLPQMLVRLALSKTPNQTRTTDTPRIIPAEALPHQSSLMLSSNSALLRQAAHRKGISCSSPASGITFLGQAENRILFYSGMSNRTSSVARDATNDKNWTCALLREAGIKTPTGRSFELNQMEEAWQFSASLQTSVVVKPLVGSGGRGVTTDISDRDHFIAAWHYACTKARSGILVEEYVKGRDFRVVVIDSWIASVTERIPAYVIGDSINTIEKLLYIKNIERSRNPYYAVKPMMLTEMNLRNLELQGFNKQSVLESGRRLQLHTVANIGAGGESRDLSEATHPDWAEIMVKARIAVYNPIHVGIDLIAEDVSQSPHNQRWAIIEINTNPDLAMIHFPGEGASRDLAGALIDTLLPSTARQRPQLESCKVTISGHVQNVGFRRWIKKQAIMHGISGWVRNNSKQQTVEAELSGTPSALQSFVKICEKGPKAARVESVHISAIPAKALNDFVVRKTLT
jgi:D-alanine-D-alanine ligase-like ATP-grasp enzyme/acylphosphatase